MLSTLEMIFMHQVLLQAAHCVSAVRLQIILQAADSRPSGPVGGLIVAWRHVWSGES